MNSGSHSRARIVKMVRSAKDPGAPSPESEKAASAVCCARVLRSCARCGGRFGAGGREYVCPNCRNHFQASRELSFREKQIVGLVRQAKANKEIAYELCLTEGTVKDYLHNIFQKLSVRNRTELALKRDSELSYQRPAPLPGLIVKRA